MTPKEKAIQLFDNFYDKIEDIEVKCGQYCQGGFIDKEQPAKQCALIAVDEIIKNMEGKEPDYQEKTYWHPIDYWQQVKTEIKNL